jgi:hypothetical protein
MAANMKRQNKKRAGLLKTLAGQILKARRLLKISSGLGRKAARVLEKSGEGLEKYPLGFCRENILLYSNK